MQRLGLKLLILITAAGALLATTTSTASASRGLQITNAVTLATANGNLTVNIGGINIICTVTVGISLNGSIAKSAGAPIGTVLPSPASNFSGCNLGITATFLSGGGITYSGFTGSLPNIQSVNAVINAPFLANLPFIGGSCLYTGPIAAMMNRNTVTGRLATININANRSLTTPTVGCPNPLSLVGALTVLPTQPIYQLI
jgi:hypothetical protein